MWFNLIYSLKENQSFLREKKRWPSTSSGAAAATAATCSDQTAAAAAAGICLQLEGFFFLHWAQIRGNTDNHLLLQITAAAPPDMNDLISKTPLVPLLETKHGLVVKVEKAQMIKSFKYVSDLYLNGWRGSMWTHLTGRLTFVRRGISCCWSLVLDWNAPYGSSQDAGSDNVQLSEIKTF